MVAAVVVAVVIMLFSAGTISGFVSRHPTSEDDLAGDGTGPAGRGHA